MKESETLELKKSTSELKEAIISIVAILNKHQKVEVYFGVNPSGRVIGQTVTENTIREVSQTIAQNIEPKIFPMINEVTLEGKKCVHVEFSGDNVPYFAYGRAHIRVGDENRQLSAEEIKKMILETNKHRMAWDKEVCKEAKISDISTQKLKWFLKKAGKHFDTVENSLKKQRSIFWKISTLECAWKECIELMFLRLIKKLFEKRLLMRSATGITIFMTL